MTNVDASDKIDALLHEATQIYRLAGELCSKVDVGSVAGGETLQRISKMVENANELTQKAYRLMRSSLKE